MAEIAKAMKYELHTVRGMISIFGSKDGLKIVSEKVAPIASKPSSQLES